MDGIDVRMLPVGLDTSVTTKNVHIMFKYMKMACWGFEDVCSQG